MNTRLMDLLDDVAVQMGAYQPHLMAVVGQRHRKCAAHDASA